MIPKIIHRTAKTKAISGEEQRLIRRSKLLFPDWEHRLWDDRENLELLKEHLPQYVKKYEAIPKGVAKADVARCVYMHAFGGVYCDTDYKWVKAFPAELMEQACVLPISRGKEDAAADGFRLGNAVFASEKGHLFWLEFLGYIFSHNHLGSLGENQIEKTTGPEGLTDFYLANRARYPDIRLVKRSVFHPKLAPGGLFAETRLDTIGIHHCWGSWRSKNLVVAGKTVFVRKVSSFL